MKTISTSICTVLVVVTSLFTSCERDVEYRAKVKVLNTSGLVVTDFSIADFSTIDNLAVGEEQSVEIKWIGEHYQLLGNYDNSIVFLRIAYTIGDKKFNVSNEKDAKIDSYGDYYSEKVITKGSDVQIVIEADGYEIVGASIN